jgi:hypothetical protein
MLFQIECEHCGTQQALGSTSLGTTPGGKLEATFQFPAGWTAEAIVGEGTEPLTLCDSCTSLWRAAQQLHREAFRASAVEAKAVRASKLH